LTKKDKFEVMLKSLFKLPLSHRMPWGRSMSSKSFRDVTGMRVRSTDNGVVLMLDESIINILGSAKDSRPGLKEILGVDNEYNFVKTLSLLELLKHDTVVSHNDISGELATMEDLIAKGVIFKLSFKCSLN
jgi:hypothetical protein